MKIALIAHDRMKDKLIEFVKENKSFFEKNDLVATGTTGKLISENTGLIIKRMQSGPYGGDQQIGALIATNDMDLVIFFRDPLTAQPHEPDVTALLRLCDVHDIPLATNPMSAKLMIGYYNNKKNFQ